MEEEKDFRMGFLLSQEHTEKLLDIEHMINLPAYYVICQAIDRLWSTCLMEKVVDINE